MNNLPGEIQIKILEYLPSHSIYEFMYIDFSYYTKRVHEKLTEIYNGFDKSKIYLIIIGNNEWEDVFIICPYCNEIAGCGAFGIADGFELDDYVTKPMLWCDSCGARCMFDTTCDELLRTDPYYINVPGRVKKLGHISLFFKMYPHLESKIKNKIYTEENINNSKIFYEVNLLKINRVVNWKLVHYIKSAEEFVKCINSNISLPTPSQEDLRRFIASNYDKKIADEIGLNDAWITDTSLMQLGIECGTYNAERPIRPYPKNFYLDHDGVYVNLECSCIRDKKEKILYENYWGD